MEPNPKHDKISLKENNLIINTSESRTYNNIETTESLNSPKNQSDIKNTYNNKSSKLLNLINKNDSPPSILMNIFNKWKNITFLKEKNFIKPKRKILIKKTLNIRRPNGNQDKERQKIKILKKQNLIGLNEESERRKKVIKFLEERLMAYIKRKDVLKKYYNIWIEKVFNKEIRIGSKITKKTISIIRFKDNKKDEEKKNDEDERMEKIKNIIKYKNPLKIYFNSWKNKSFKEVELKNNKILVNSNEKEKPSYKIKIVKNITVKRPKKLKEKRKKKLIKLIESKDILKQNYKEILRKYYNIWIANIGIQEDENIIKEDKPVKIITGIEDNNIEDINANQNNIEIDNIKDDKKEKQ